jgi:hypothetical protein
MMPPAPSARLSPGQPVAWGDRLLVPLVRVVTLSHDAGGMILGNPVALLIGEGDAWSFVSLEEGAGQEILRDGLPAHGSPAP